MPDEPIPPVLTPEEWRDPESVAALARALPTTADGIARTVAVANHALPDGDPRKLTREDIDACGMGWVAGEEMARLMGEPTDGEEPHLTAARRFVAATHRLLRLAEKLDALLPPPEA